MNKPIIIVIMLLMQAGCTTNPDPAQGGLIDGLAGLGEDGTYERRIRERQARLDHIRAQKDAVLSERSDLDYVADKKRAELDQLNREYSRLHRDVADMRTRLGNMHLETKGKVERRIYLEKELTDVNKELGRLRSDSKRGTKTMEKYAAEKRDLEKRIDELALEIELLGR